MSAIPPLEIYFLSDLLFSHENGESEVASVSLDFLGSAGVDCLVDGWVDDLDWRNAKSAGLIVRNDYRLYFIFLF